ncbi:multidrug transporter [Teredinibacter waterburyi]|jgi:hypothetical protein|uniref:multidrug transporter n=1 Tax=Teredinibacter waterburyi TaxID=1500538 RepID=UPI00165FCFF1|nr:multidrug transporter [Teredinibacter waterburyi]
MLYTAFAGITIIFALVAVALGLRLVARAGWFMSWLRGTMGLLLITLAVLFALTAMDMFSYRQLTKNKILATLSFSEVENQHYSATLVLIRDGSEQTFDLRGDQWQIDARIIKWSGLIEQFGAKPGYRFDRLSGRYYSLEDEYRKPRTLHQLSSSEYWVDFWAWAKAYGDYVPGVEAAYGNATYLPMADGALYEISLSSTGLLAKPMNDVAEKSVRQWQ